MEGEVIELLQRRGVKVKGDWLQAVLPTCPRQARTAHDRASYVFAQILHADVAVTVEPTLPRNVLQMHKEVIQGRHLLAVINVRDIAGPQHEFKEAVPPDLRDEVANEKHERATGQRCLLFSLSDGKQVVRATEYRPLVGVNKIPRPGAKVLIRDVPVQRGMLLLDGSNCRVFGSTLDMKQASQQQQQAPQLQQPYAQQQQARPQQPQPQQQPRPVQNPQPNQQVVVQSNNHPIATVASATPVKGVWSQVASKISTTKRSSKKKSTSSKSKRVSAIGVLPIINVSPPAMPRLEKATNKDAMVDDIAEFSDFSFLNKSQPKQDTKQPVMPGMPPYEYLEDVLKRAASQPAVRAQVKATVFQLITKKLITAETIEVILDDCTANVVASFSQACMKSVFGCTLEERRANPEIKAKYPSRQFSATCNAMEKIFTLYLVKGKMCVIESARDITEQDTKDMMNRLRDVGNITSASS